MMAYLCYLISDKISNGWDPSQAQHSNQLSIYDALHFFKKLFSSKGFALEPPDQLWLFSV